MNVHEPQMKILRAKRRMTSLVCLHSAVEELLIGFDKRSTAEREAKRCLKKYEELKF